LILMELISIISALLVSPPPVYFHSKTVPYSSPPVELTCIDSGCRLQLSTGFVYFVFLRSFDLFVVAEAKDEALTIM
jgi:hypothetical protein